MASPHSFRSGEWQFPCQGGSSLWSQEGLSPAIGVHRGQREGGADFRHFTLVSLAVDDRNMPVKTDCYET